MRLLLVTLAVIAAGCQYTNSYMTLVENPPVVVPPEGKASVVFMRPSASMGGARAAAVFDITTGQDLIGVFSLKMKVVRMMDPGEHFFMGVISPGRSIMRAQLEAGKIYYVKLFGGQVHPLRTDSQEDVIRSYWNSTRFVERNSASETWLADNLDSIVKHRNQAFVNWADLSDDRRAQFDLTGVEGVTVPIR